VLRFYLVLTVYDFNGVHHVGTIKVFRRNNNWI